MCSTVMSPGRGKSGTGRAAATHLAAEQTVNEEDEGPLQAIDDGEQVGHDTGYGSNLENAQHPGAPQDEELGKGLERQQPGGEDLQRVRSWEVAVVLVGHAPKSGLRLSLHDPPPGWE